MNLKVGRGERIRTSDLSVPNRAHYQAVLRPVPLRLQLSLAGLAILATVRSSGQGKQEITSSFQRSRAVTELVLNLGRQLGKSEVVRLGKKNGIIAKAPGSARLQSDMSLAYPLRGIQDQPITRRNCSDRDEAGGSLRYLGVPDLVEQLID